MLKIRWEKTEAKGYDDIIPTLWLAFDGIVECADHSIDHKGRNSSARCSIVAAGRRVTLDYGGEHKNFNINNIIDPGILTIEFDSPDRAVIEEIYWQDDASSSLEKAPVNWQIIEELGSFEGGTHLVSHLRRERDLELAAKKIESVRAAQGKLVCEACKFDFQEKYGSLGKDFCEVHHRKPLALGYRESHLHDLAILCANCHRMIHRTGNPIMDVPEFKERYVR